MRAGWIVQCAIVFAAACGSDEPQSVTRVVGPAGGTIVGPADVQLTIPSGALAMETSITVSIADARSHPSLGPSFAAAGRVFAFEPHGLEFALPVTITLPVSETSEGLVALRSQPGGGWEVLAADVGGTAEISTSSFSYYCVAAPVGAPPVDAGLDAPGGGGQCSARTPDPSPTGTVADMMGVVPASGTYFPMLDLATIIDGYADVKSNGGVMIELTDFAQSCGMWKQGIGKLGGKQFQIFIYASNVSTGTYTSQFYAASLHAADPTATAGPCNQTGADGLGVSGYVTISAVDATHVAGSFQITIEGSTVSGSFDVPICRRLPNLDPPYCCAT